MNGAFYAGFLLPETVAVSGSLFYRCFAQPCNLYLACGLLHFAGGKAVGIRFRLQK